MKLPSAIRPCMLYVQAAFPADLLADIEIYAHSQSFPSRSETIRQLMRYALVKKEEERK